MSSCLPGALDAQLQRDAGVSHFEYMVLAMLSEAPEHTLRMTALAAQTHSTLPRLSHVVTRLVNRGFVERIPCPQDKRATNAHLDRCRLGTHPGVGTRPRRGRPLIGDRSTVRRTDRALREITTAILAASILTNDSV